MAGEIAIIEATKSLYEAIDAASGLVMDGLWTEGTLAERVSGSPLLKILAKVVPAEFQALAQNVDPLYAVREVMTDSVNVANNMVDTFVAQHSDKLRMAIGVLSHAGDISDQVMTAFGAVPAVIADDPKRVLELKAVMEGMRNQMERIQAELDNVLILAAVADHKQGRYAGHGKIGEMPQDQPTQPTENDRGFYWYDNGSGKITFAAAKDLSEALQLDIKRMAEKNDYEAVFDIKN